MFGGQVRLKTIGSRPPSPITDHVQLRHAREVPFIAKAVSG
jgi:hypothetical protein